MIPILSEGICFVAGGASGVALVLLWQRRRGIPPRQSEVARRSEIAAYTELWATLAAVRRTAMEVSGRPTRLPVTVGDVAALKSVITPLAVTFGHRLRLPICFVAGGASQPCYGRRGRTERSRSDGSSGTCSGDSQAYCDARYSTGGVPHRDPLAVTFDKLLGQWDLYMPRFVSRELSLVLDRIWACSRTSGDDRSSFGVLAEKLTEIETKIRDRCPGGMLEAPTNTGPPRVEPTEYERRSTAEWQVLTRLLIDLAHLGKLAVDADPDFSPSPETRIGACRVIARKCSELLDLLGAKAVSGDPRVYRAARTLVPQARSLSFKTTSSPGSQGPSPSGRGSLRSSIQPRSGARTGMRSCSGNLSCRCFLDSSQDGIGDTPGHASFFVMNSNDQLCFRCCVSEERQAIWCVQGENHPKAIIVVVPRQHPCQCWNAPKGRCVHSPDDG